MAQHNQWEWNVSADQFQQMKNARKEKKVKSKSFQLCDAKWHIEFYAMKKNENNCGLYLYIDSVPDSTGRIEVNYHFKLNNKHEKKGGPKTFQKTGDNWGWNFISKKTLQAMQSMKIQVIIQLTDYQKSFHSQRQTLESISKHFHVVCICGDNMALNNNLSTNCDACEKKMNNREYFFHCSKNEDTSADYKEHVDYCCKCAAQHQQIIT
eukprot:450375_1